MPTINQQTAEAGKEPTLTLRTFRKGTFLDIDSMKNEVILSTCCVLEGVWKNILSVMSRLWINRKADGSSISDALFWLIDVEHGRCDINYPIAQMVENIFFSHLAHLLVSYQQLSQSCSIWFKWSWNVAGVLWPEYHMWRCWVACARGYSCCSNWRCSESIKTIFNLRGHAISHTPKPHDLAALGVSEWVCDKKE